MSEMKTIPFKEVINIAMVSRNEGKIKNVIHEGILKEWVGIGWIDLRKATKADKDKYPTVVS
jgi:hypothetical protein